VSNQFRVKLAGAPTTDGENKMTSDIGRPVIVTTEYRGVFFGFATDTSGDTITLRNARNCIYWSSKTGGFMGLASRGPGAGSRIGERAEQIELRKITSVVEVTEAAAAAWEKEPSYVG
jgi:hypothetical protein